MEEHGAIIARIGREQEKELKAARPEDRREIREQYELSRASARHVLDLEVRRTAAVIEAVYLSQELAEERGRCPRAGAAGPALQERALKEEAALYAQHAYDDSMLRILLEHSAFNRSERETAWRVLGRLQDREWSNMLSRQDLETIRAADVREPTRGNDGKANRRGSSRGKDDDRER